MTREQVQRCIDEAINEGLEPVRVKMARLTTPVAAERFISIVGGELREFWNEVLHQMFLKGLDSGTRDNWERGIELAKQARPDVVPPEAEIARLLTEALADHNVPPTTKKTAAARTEEPDRFTRALEAFGADERIDLSDPAARAEATRRLLLGDARPAPAPILPTGTWKERYDALVNPPPAAPVTHSRVDRDERLRWLFGRDFNKPDPFAAAVEAELTLRGLPDTPQNRSTASQAILAEHPELSFKLLGIPRPAKEIPVRLDATDADDRYASAFSRALDREDDPTDPEARIRATARAMRHLSREEQLALLIGAR